VREREEEGDVRDENSTKRGRSPPLPPSLTSLPVSFLFLSSPGREERERGGREERERGRERGVCD
jgi:hypothetical protein